MNKRQKISAWIIGYVLVIIFYSSSDIMLGIKYSISWIVIGGLLQYLFRDKSY